MIGSPVREDSARRAGATAFHDYRAEDVRGVVAATCPEGFDVVIDAVGRVGAADLGLSLLAGGGVIGIYGIDDFGKLRLDPDAARGTFTCYKGGYDEPETHGQVVERFAAGALDASIWLDLERPFELDQINEAIEATRSRKAVKALVRIKG